MSNQEINIENIAWKLDFMDDLEEDVNALLNELISEVHFSMMRQCPEYAKNYKEKEAFEEREFRTGEVYDAYNELENRTDYPLMRTLFMLGVKTGIRLGK